MTRETSYGITTDNAELSELLNAEFHFRRLADPAAKSDFWSSVRAFYIEEGISPEVLLELEWRAQHIADDFDHELKTIGVA